ncbi:MAG: hypothetical protein DME55_11995 [Verrucomicrobia bacterium]|nr:MAG: hypothetical protein DME55_11995 [Verrucomicrobiota bacterium]
MSEVVFIDCQLGCLGRLDALRINRSPLPRQGEGEGEGLYGASEQVQFQTPHLRPLPLPKGRGGTSQAERGADLVSCGKSQFGEISSIALFEPEALIHFAHSAKPLILSILSIS